MKTTKIFIMLIVAWLLSISFVSCSGGDEDEKLELQRNNNGTSNIIPEALYGTWSHTDISRGVQYTFEFTFNRDLTGIYKNMNTKGRYAIGVFTYKMSGNIIICEGNYINTEENATIYRELTWFGDSFKDFNDDTYYKVSSDSY